MLKRAFMAATLLALLSLVVVTPQLVGPREDISSIPRLIVTYYDDTLVVLVTSLSGTYLYPRTELNVSVDDIPLLTRNATQSLSLEGRIPLNGTMDLALQAAAMDARRIWFAARVDLTVTPGTEDWNIRLVPEPDALPRELTAQDLAESPFATLLKRQEAS